MGGKRRHELRAEMRRILQNVDKRWVGAASHELCLNLSKLVDKELGNDCEHVLAFFPHFSGEVDLGSFINEQLGRRKIYLPTTGPDRQMDFYEIGPSWRTDLVPGSFDIPEPKPDPKRKYNSENFWETVVLVPGLVFDRNGNRLGRGRGYYDQFLGQGQLIDSIKIGVGWSLQLVDQIPPEEHDVAMDWICVEREYFFSSAKARR